MPKKLLVVGGIANLLVAVYHVIMGWNFFSITGVSAQVRALLLSFDLGAIVTMLFFAYTSIFLPQELLSSRLGRAVLGMCALIYLLRAAEEFSWFQFHWVTVISCGVLGAMYAVLVACVDTRTGEHPAAFGHAA